MADVNDMDLVRKFARHNSEAAFAELVRRHLNLVYSVALRFTANPGDAEEAAQAVFIILARKAAGLSARTALTGWLYETTRFTALRLLRTRTRRQAHEQEAFMQSSLDQSGADNLWRQIAPHLETAMARLAERDRTLLALRFYENKTGAEAAALMGIREEAAHKRTVRALEKLRTFFSKRGVSSTTAVLAGAISANSVQAAPVALAKAVTAIAVAKGATASASTLTLIKGALNIMTWTKVKTALVAGAAILLATGTTTLAIQHESQPAASFSYKLADDVWQWTAGVDKTKLVIRLTVSSRNRSVLATNIVFTIQSAVKGPIPVRLATNGEVIDFPHDEVLRRENPNITSNQPKGSLVMTLWAYWPVPDDLVFRYHRLDDVVAETSKAIASATSTISQPADVGWLNYVESLFTRTPKVKGVIIEFSKSSARKAKIEIEAASGTKTYRADASGRIKLDSDNALRLENPEVKFSEKPLVIGPDLQF